MPQGWHVNLETGEPGECRARISCPFGNDDLHFDTESDARKFYEAKMSKYTLAELVQKSRMRSPWRSISWEERKQLLQAYVDERVQITRKLRKKRIRIDWQNVVNSSFDVLGYADEEARTLNLAEGAEALEETSVKALIVHELAHFLEPRRSSEDHGKSWRSGTELLSSSDEDIRSFSFQKSSQHSVLEALRRETQKLELRAPKHIGKCARGHSFYANIIPRDTSCSLCREDVHFQKDYTLFSAVEWDSFDLESSEGQKFIANQLGRMGFGKENRTHG